MKKIKLTLNPRKRTSQKYLALPNTSRYCDTYLTSSICMYKYSWWGKICWILFF